MFGGRTKGSKAQRLKGSEGLKGKTRALALSLEASEPLSLELTRRLATRQFASAFSIAATSSGASGFTLLGKNATTLPSLPMTYLLKFHAGRFPVAPR
jgi:hypothetical protein